MISGKHHIAVVVGVGGGYLGMLLMALPATLDKPVSPQAAVALVFLKLPDPLSAKLLF